MLLQLDKVGKRYGQRQVLRGVDLTIPRGQDRHRRYQRLREIDELWAVSTCAPARLSVKSSGNWSLMAAAWCSPATEWRAVAVHSGNRVAGQMGSAGTPTARRDEHRSVSVAVLLRTVIADLLAVCASTVLVAVLRARRD